MNMIVSITPTDQPPVARASCPDRFLGQIIGKAAEVEAWVADRIRAADPTAKLTCPLGPKIELLRKLLDEKRVPVKDAAKTRKILDMLRPYLELRSSLAHAVRTRECVPEGRYHAYIPAGIDGDTAWAARIILHDTEFVNIINGINDLANRLRQQTPA